ncbi:protein of unknown function [Muriicola jejuensis]|uniref:DUF3291 domain-containing protein n=1 Tax=Muriicola jejuensis TaxID=504488 RepID=A0A6P0U791_9FLAO|nr:DUF3291 domain-containing protein [Muriicola jejuensis]NER08954.1 DUF3291 domain-containing protein [Muriicola jejuensis]SMP12647.1 protein of unknown function [Muriicola jejuensis]
MAFYFAQINVARAKYPLDDPRMSDFIENIPGINALAEESPGFVWRWVEEEDNRTVEVFGDKALVVNMSLWKSRDDLIHFTYKTGHSDIYKRRKEWFSNLETSHLVCWYTQNVEIELEEAKSRMYHLECKGETPYAFTFKSEYSEKEVLEYLAANPSLL